MVAAAIHQQSASTQAITSHTGMWRERPEQICSRRRSGSAGQWACGQLQWTAAGWAEWGQGAGLDAAHEESRCLVCHNFAAPPLQQQHFWQNYSLA